MLAAAPAGTVVITPTRSRAVVTEDYDPRKSKEHVELKYEPNQPMQGKVTVHARYLTKAS